MNNLTKSLGICCLLAVFFVSSMVLFQLRHAVTVQEFDGIVMSSTDVESCSLALSMMMFSSLALVLFTIGNLLTTNNKG